MDDSKDPGWWAAVPDMAVGFIPFFGDRFLSTIRPRLTGARARLLAAMARIWLILLVLTTLGEPEETSYLFPMLLLGWATASTFVFIAFFEKSTIKRMPADTDMVAAFSMMHRGAVLFSLSPALVGFVGFFLGGGILVYVLGMAVSHVALIVERPTSGLLRRLQDRANELGIDVDLWSAVTAREEDL